MAQILLGRVAGVHELATSQVVELLQGWLPPESRIPVRMATKAGDDVSMSTGLRRRMLQYFSELRWRLFNQLLCEFHRALQV